MKVHQTSFMNCKENMAVTQSDSIPPANNLIPGRSPPLRPAPLLSQLCTACSGKAVEHDLTSHSSVCILSNSGVCKLSNSSIDTIGLVGCGYSHCRSAGCWDGEMSSHPGAAITHSHCSCSRLQQSPAASICLRTAAGSS